MGKFNVRVYDKNCVEIENSENWGIVKE